MHEIPLDVAVGNALESLLNERLAVLAGAGLSMAPPSSLPSAAAIAASAKQKYDATYGGTRDPLPSNIEDQAEFFFGRGELATVFFRRLIDGNVFAAPPNSGHFAIADLLLVQAIKTAITTNVDVMIETAGQLLYGEIAAGLDRGEMVKLADDSSPLLKIHGCRRKDPDNMVWAPGQLTMPPVSDRIASSSHWLVNRLLNRDLLIIGYSTDWDYLNQVLETVLGTVRPSRILVVDPASSATFAEKAPQLFALGERANGTFEHVRVSGAQFLDALRQEFSKSYIRRVLEGGAEAFRDIAGHDPSPETKEPPDLDNEVLWRIRRDLEGCSPNDPSVMRSPPAESTLGLTILQLRAKGASADGTYWKLDEDRIRVLRAPNQLLHKVQAGHARETAPAIAPDIIIAVGAEAVSLPSNIVREGSAATIARGTASRWLTRSQATQKLELNDIS